MEQVVVEVRVETPAILGPRQHPAVLGDNLGVTAALSHLSRISEWCVFQTGVPERAFQKQCGSSLAPEEEEMRSWQSRSLLYRLAVFEVEQRS